MFIPATGGRLLITGKNCPRQVAHNDFQVPGKKDMDKLPGYFMILNGADEFVLWVSDYSHKFARRKFKHIKKAAKVLRLRKIVIPP